MHRARPLLFSTALPPAATAATIEAVKILMESEEYTEKLWENARYFKEGLKSHGFDIGKSETPITPVMIGEEAKTMEFSRELLEEGVFVSGIVYPTVPKGTGVAGSCSAQAIPRKIWILRSGLLKRSEKFGNNLKGARDEV